MVKFLTLFYFRFSAGLRSTWYDDRVRAGEPPAPIGDFGAKDAGEDSARLGERLPLAGSLGADPG